MDPDRRIAQSWSHENDSGRIVLQSLGASLEPMIDEVFSSDYRAILEGVRSAFRAKMSDSRRTGEPLSALRSIGGTDSALVTTGSRS